MENKSTLIHESIHRTIRGRYQNVHFAVEALLEIVGRELDPIRARRVNVNPNAKILSREVGVAEDVESINIDPVVGCVTNLGSDHVVLGPASEFASRPGVDPLGTDSRRWIQGAVGKQFVCPDPNLTIQFDRVSCDLDRPNIVRVGDREDAV